MKKLVSSLNQQITKIILIWLIFSLIIPSISFSSQNTIEEILKNPDTYDQKTIKVKGMVTNLKLKISRRGNPYTVFHIMDKAGNSLKVFMWEHQNIHEGEIVEVTGIFRKIKHIGPYIFYNEIEAQSIRRIK